MRTIASWLLVSCLLAPAGASAQVCAGVEAAWLGEGRASGSEPALHAALEGASECLAAARLRFSGTLRISITLTTDPQGRVQEVEPLIVDTTPRRGLYACVAPALRAARLPSQSASLSVWVQHVASREEDGACPRPAPPTTIRREIQLEILEGEPERLESALGTMRRSWTCYGGRGVRPEEVTGTVVGSFVVRNGFGLTEGVELDGPPVLVTCARRWIEGARFRGMMGDEGGEDARIQVHVIQRGTPLAPAPRASPRRRRR